MTKMIVSFWNKELKQKLWKLEDEIEKKMQKKKINNDQKDVFTKKINYTL